MSKKGLTPIISIILLLLITVALAGAAYTFLQGYLSSQVKKTFTVPDGGAYCISEKITVYVTNTGYQHEMNAGPNGDFEIAAIDSVDVTNQLSGDLAVVSGSSTRVINIDCSEVPCDESSPGSYSGPHTIDLGTSSTIYHTSIFCP